jgi:hypothetical protein
MAITGQKRRLDQEGVSSGARSNYELLFGAQACPKSMGGQIGKQEWALLDRPIGCVEYSLGCRTGPRDQIEREDAKEAFEDNHQEFLLAGCLRPVSCPQQPLCCHDRRDWRKVIGMVLLGTKESGERMIDVRDGYETKQEEGQSRRSSLPGWICQLARGGMDDDGLSAYAVPASRSNAAIPFRSRSSSS